MDLPVKPGFVGTIGVITWNWQIYSKSPVFIIIVELYCDINKYFVSLSLSLTKLIFIMQPYYDPTRRNVKKQVGDTSPPTNQPTNQPMQFYSQF